MPQVNFKIGRSTRLSSEPLNNGTIYFTEDTRRLYIDTATARLPITGDSITGKIFWVYLPSGDWTKTSSSVTTYAQTITTAYNEQGDSEAVDLSTMVTEDSVIFIGRTTYGTADDDGVYPAIVSTESSATSITFATFATGDSATAPTEDLWVQIYTPNPATTAFSTISVISSVYTTRSYLYAANWTTDANGNHVYTLSFDNMDLTSIPYIINLSDDSLENSIEFADIISVEESYDGEYTTTLTFTASSTIDFNIAVDICIFIVAGGTTSEEGEWALVNFNTATISSNTVNYTGKPLLSDVDGDRELLVYYVSGDNETYSLLTNVEYVSTGVYRLTFDESFSGGIKAFKIYVLQLNNISTIYSATLSGGDNAWTATELTDDDGNSLGTYYMQVWPTSSSSDRVSEKYLPLIYPASSDYFTEFQSIIETKIYNGKIYFYAARPLEEIKIKIVDFI